MKKFLALHICKLFLKIVGVFISLAIFKLAH